jgi:DNA-binding GntR family transcriptional regulator
MTDPSLARLVETSIADRATDQLRRAILDGRYPPGTRLVERTLAAQLGTSHIPIREAIARLSEEGLVERHPRRTSRVATLTARDLREISSVRAVLEELVATRVQDRWSIEVERELRGIVKRMTAAAERGDVQAVFGFDRRLHQRLWELSDHHLVVQLASQLRGRMHRYLLAVTLALAEGELLEHARMHGDLLDALAGRDPERARAALHEHVTIGAERALAALRHERG